MATIEEAIVAKLRATPEVTALIGAAADCRVFPHASKQGTTKPYVTYYRVSSSTNQLASLSNKAANMEWVRITIEVWSQNYLAGKAIDKEVRIALDGYSGVSSGVTIHNCRRVDSRDQYEPDTQPKPLFRCGSDYMIHYKL
jgi:hypothetical protein